MRKEEEVGRARRMYRFVVLESGKIHWQWKCSRLIRYHCESMEFVVLNLKCWNKEASMVVFLYHTLINSGVGAEENRIGLKQAWAFILDECIRKKKSCEGSVLYSVVIILSLFKEERGTFVNKSLVHFYNSWIISSQIVYIIEKRATS